MTLFIVPVMYDLFYRKPPVNIDVGDDGMDDLPDDAAEFATEFAARRAAEGKNQPEPETPDTAERRHLKLPGKPDTENGEGRHNDTRYPQRTRNRPVRSRLAPDCQGVNPAAMKVQQIADEAGIGKGTVYEYFASKDEILQGMALYCFDTEIARIAVLMEPCTTLQELEDAVMAYLQDLSGNRMGTYQVIASSIGARENLRGMDECVQALRGVLHRTMAALRQKGEINPALPDDYCDLALLSAAAGGLIGLCYVSKHPDALTPLQNLRVLIHCALNP